MNDITKSPLKKVVYRRIYAGEDFVKVIHHKQSKHLTTWFPACAVDLKLLEEYEKQLAARSA